MNIYRTTQYKIVLKHLVQTKRKGMGRSVSFAKLADSCKIQRTYLSRVLNGDAHLNSDQLFNACTFLELDPETRHYLSLLLDFERSSVPARKELILEQIRAIQKKQLLTEGHLSSKAKTQTTDPGDSNWQHYYLDPVAQLIHMFLTIDRYRKDINLVKQALPVSEDRFMESLRALERSGLLKIRENEVQVERGHFHLSKNSPLYDTYQALMRSLVQSKISLSSKEGRYAFNAMYTADPNAQARIQEEILKCVKSIQKIVEESDNRHVYQMEIVLFKW